MRGFWFWLNLFSSVIVAMLVSFGAVFVIAAIPVSLFGAFGVAGVLIGSALLVLGIVVPWADWATERFS